MHYRKNLRHFLNFINNNGCPALPFNEMGQTLRPRGKFPENIRQQQINIKSIRVSILKPGGFARPSWAKQKITLEGVWEKSSYEFHICFLFGGCHAINIA